MTSNSKSKNLKIDVEDEDEDEELSLSASGDSTSATSDKTGTQQSEAKKMKDLQEELTKKESETVFKLRVVVIFVLMLAAAAVTGVIYLVTTRGESGESKSQYDGAAGKVSLSRRNSTSRVKMLTKKQSQGLYKNKTPETNYPKFFA